MNKEYKEFYRDESLIPGDVGVDISGGGTGGAGGGGWGGGAGGGTGGAGGGGWGGSAGGGTGGAGGGSGAKEKIWKTLATLRWSCLLPGVLKSPSSGKILKHAGKCLKSVNFSCALRIEIGIIEEYAEHLDCVIIEYISNGQKFNMSETDAVAENFFSKAYVENLDSELELSVKWQRGHYPLSISSVGLRVVDENSVYGELNNVGLTKKFRKMCMIAIKNRKMNFIKIEG
jgi:hypothetical protein